MKSYKQYLAESKKVYEFKIKVAGEVPADFLKHIKTALAQYKVESCTKGNTSPIQETQSGFPSLKNVELTIFEVTTSYPATSLQVASAVSECAGVPLSHMIVRNLAEDAEQEEINNPPEGEGALLGKDCPTENNQDKAGEKQVMSFLKDLSKNPTTGTVYTGVNDVLLAKSAPVEKVAKEKTTTTGTVSAIGSTKTKLPDPRKGR